MEYRIFRLMERFPKMFGTPEEFYDLPADTQSLMLAYELVRESEEALRIG